LPEAIQNDVDFCADAVRRNHQLFHHFPEQLRTEPGFLQRVFDDAQQVLALVQCIHVSNNDVEDREKALMSLGRVAGVSPELIIPHISQIIACLGDPELRIRLTVPTVLASLGTHMSPHFPAIEALMHSASPGVKTAVEMTFEWLEHIPEAKAALDRVRRAMDAGGACAVHSASDSSGLSAVDPVAANQESASVRIWEFSRNPESFRKALLEGPELASCRQALIASGFAPELECGAKVFVRPGQYSVVLEALRMGNLRLEKRHVIVTAEFEHLVAFAIEHLRSSPHRVQRTAQTTMPIGVAEAALELEMPVLVSNTFLEIPIPSSLCSSATRGAKTA